MSSFVIVVTAAGVRRALVRVRVAGERTSTFIRFLEGHVQEVLLRRGLPGRGFGRGRCGRLGSIRLDGCRLLGPDQAQQGQHGNLG